MFQNCIRCTICVENCSVFGVNPLFPGPKQAGPDAQRFRLDGERSVDDWVKYCCQCKRCEVACPYGVDIANIILRAQIRNREEKGGYFASNLFAYNHLMGRIASLASPLANRIAATRWARRLAAKAGLSTYLKFPEFRFLSLGKSIRVNYPRWGGKKKKVVFFYGCYLNYNRPDIGRKIRNLLLALNLDVVAPMQTCCGLPALGNGNLKVARKYAEKNAATLAPYIDAGYDIIYSCTSCGLTLTHEYPGIMGIPEGKKIAENSYDLYEYILNLMEDGFIEFRPGEVKKKVAYHVPCHLRAIDIGYPAARVMSMIPGLECTVIDDHCCGLSGSYGFKQVNEETSRAIGEKAANSLIRTGAEAIVADCGACRMQLGQLTGLPALDPAEIVTESLRRTGVIRSTSSELILRDLKQIRKKIVDSI